MRRDKLDILLVSPYFYPEGGGAERYAYQIACHLVARGHRVTVLCSTRNGRSYTGFDCGIEIIRERPDVYVTAAPLKINLPWRLSRLLKERHFDLVNLNYYLAYYPEVAAVVGRNRQVPLVLTYHHDLFREGLLAGTLLNIYRRSIQRLVLNLATRVIVVSPCCYDESACLEPFRDKLVRVPPGVDVYRYNVGTSLALHDNYGLPFSAKIVLFVGSLSYDYQPGGVNYLIKAFPQVLREVEDAYLVLVGQGDMLPDYKEMSASLGILPRVFFTGSVPEARLVEFYRNSHLVVLPSTTAREGLATVLIEANACGRPVVGSRVGDIPYVIRDGESGLLVPPRDTEALAGAITRLLKDEDLNLQMGQAGRRIAEEYSWDRLAERTAAVYQEVAAL